jgi:hypothetical protein
MIRGGSLGLIRIRVVPRLTASLEFLGALFICVDNEPSGCVACLHVYTDIWRMTDTETIVEGRMRRRRILRNVFAVMDGKSKQFI